MMIEQELKLNGYHLRNFAGGRLYTPAIKVLAYHAEPLTAAQSELVYALVKEALGTTLSAREMEREVGGVL